MILSMLGKGYAAVPGTLDSPRHEIANSVADIAPPPMHPSTGAFVKDKFGDGKLDAPVVAGPFFILYPELSIATGILQVNRADDHRTVPSHIL